MVTEFAKGVGLPGRVWAGGQPFWVENVVEDSNFPRWRVAQRVGLRGAFGFPIYVDADMLGGALKWEPSRQYESYCYVRRGKP